VGNWFIYIYIYIYIYKFQNVFPLCPTPRLHCFLSSHWPSFRFRSFMAFLIPSNQFFFGLPRVLFCFGIQFSAMLGNLPSAILWTWPHHVSWVCSISFLTVYQNDNTRLNLNCGYNWLHLLCSTVQRKSYAPLILNISPQRRPDTFARNQRERHMKWHSVCLKQHTNRHPRRT